MFSIWFLQQEQSKKHKTMQLQNMKIEKRVSRESLLEATAMAANSPVPMNPLDSLLFRKVVQMVDISTNL